MGAGCGIMLIKLTQVEFPAVRHRRDLQCLVTLFKEGIRSSG